MRRSLILAAALWPLMNVAANAACPTTPGKYGCPMMTEASNSVLYASAFGVVADGALSGLGAFVGGTSDDVALKAAVDACSAKSGKLVLPPGKILLTGAATINIANCNIVGVGVPGSTNNALSQGTMFLITSTTVKPFVIKSNWKLEGVELYWPNQTGVDVYPPAFSGDGTSSVSSGIFQDVIIVNAYDGVVQTDYNSTLDNSVELWGNIKFINYTAFAVNDNIRINNVGDGLTFVLSRFIPGAWLSTCFNCEARVGKAASTMRVVHVTKPKSVGAGLNISMVEPTVVGARYMFLIDNGATVAESHINGITSDAVGTIVDTSAGGHWYGFTAAISGTGASCEIPAVVWGQPNGGNAPCFNMGPDNNSELVIENLHIAGSRGHYIVTAGTAVTVTNSEMLSTAGANDGAEYSVVSVTGAGAQIRLQNNRFGGSWGGTHSHGVTTAAGITIGSAKIEGNAFFQMVEAINATLPDGASVANNASSLMTGAGPDFVLQGTNGILYHGNVWQRSPVPTIVPGSCGTSPPTVAGGPNSGYFTTGTGTITSCQISMPILLYGTCTFTPSSAIALGAAPNIVSGKRIWKTDFYIGGTPSSSPGMNVFYNCPGYQ